MKYMGSKARFAKDLVSIMLQGRDKTQWYVEPFAGGMNSICEVSGDKRLANDVNYYLIEMWKAIVSGWEPTEITKEFYYLVKHNQSKYPAYLVGWVGFNCSYSGKWFGGFAGKTATKIGTIRDYQAEAIRNIAVQKNKLENVIFTNMPYNQLELPKNSIIYCDPPYQGTTQYNTAFDHTMFWDWVRVTSKDHTVYVSEYSAPDDFTCIWEQIAKSSLSANGKSGSSKTSIERLFTLK